MNIKLHSNSIKKCLTFRMGFAPYVNFQIAGTLNFALITITQQAKFEDYSVTDAV